MALTQVARNGKKTGLHKVKHAAYSLFHAFNSGEIDRRSHLGQIISGMESEYASHCGYTSYSECPITLREKLRIAIGEWILQSFIVPSKGNIKDLRASINTLNRITSELGLKPTSRNVSLEQYIETKAQQRAKG